jgi:hypothetical protein
MSAPIPSWWRDHVARHVQVLDYSAGLLSRALLSEESADLEMAASVVVSELERQQVHLRVMLDDLAAA